MNIIQGQGVDAPLNELGFKQAGLFSDHYPSGLFDLVVYSNLIRSKQSIQSFLTKGLQGVQINAIAEINWGINENKAADPEVVQRYEAAVTAWNAGMLDHRIENGESAAELRDRCLWSIKWIENIQRKNILICSHGRTIRALVCLLTGQDLTQMESVSHHNLGLYKFHFGEHGWKMLLADDRSHLI